MTGTIIITGLTRRLPTPDAKFNYEDLLLSLMNRVQQQVCVFAPAMSAACRTEAGAPREVFSDGGILLSSFGFWRTMSVRHLAFSGGALHRRPCRAR